MASILVIEDDRTFARILEGFLAKHSFKVTVCYSGHEGVKVFSEQSFQLVLLDYRLPDSNGLEILEALKIREFSEKPLGCFKNGIQNKHIRQTGKKLEA